MLCALATLRELICKIKNILREKLFNDYLCYNLKTLLNRKYIMKKIFPFVFLFSFYYVNAQQWSSVGGGMGQNGFVSCFKVIDSCLYVGGAFICVGGLDTISYPSCIYASSIAKWNGNNWDTVKNFNCVGGAIESIELYNNELYIGGGFADITVHPFRSYLAKLDSSKNWSDVGNIGYPNWDVDAFYIRDGKLYISGDFNYFENASGYNHIACWDGSNFSKLANGLQGSSGHAYDIDEYNGLLVVGGSFDWAGDTSAYSVAAWDGQKWYPLDTGLLGTVTSLVVDTINNFLYAGGVYLDYAGGNGDMIRIHNIARWDGYEWSPVGDDSLGIFFAGILSLKFYRNHLFAAGFSRTGTNVDTLLTKWDHNSWHKIDGPNETIACLEVYNNELYVGGYFDHVF